LELKVFKHTKIPS